MLSLWVKLKPMLKHAYATMKKPKIPLKILGVVIQHPLLNGLWPFKAFFCFLEFSPFFLHHTKIKQRLGRVTMILQQLKSHPQCFIGILLSFVVLTKRIVVIGQIVQDGCREGMITQLFPVNWKGLSRSLTAMASWWSPLSDRATIKIIYKKILLFLRLDAFQLPTRKN